MLGLTLVLALSALSADSASGGPSAVLTLDDSNFDETLKSTDFSLVMFYAPWCGACKRMHPAFASAAALLDKGVTTGIRLAEIDVTENMKTGDAFDIKGYPTLKLFRSGEASSYHGPRDAQGIADYMERHASGKISNSNAVKELDPSNFDSFIDTTPFVFVKFFAPWCEHSKSLAPLFDEAADILSHQAGKPIRCASLDTTKYSKIAERYDLEGVPVLAYFRNGVYTEYKGSTDVRSMVASMSQLVHPASVLIQDAASMTGHLKHHDAIVLGLFSNLETQHASRFFEVGEAMRNAPFRFLHTSDAALMRQYGGDDGVVVIKSHLFASPHDTMVVRTPSDETTPDASSTKVTWDDSEETAAVAAVAAGENAGENGGGPFATKLSLMSFIHKHSLPVVGMLTDATERRYVGAGKPLLVLYFEVDFENAFDETCKFATQLREQLATAAHPEGGEWRDRMSFAVASIREYGQHLSNFGLGPERMAVSVQDFKTGSKYGYRKLQHNFRRNQPLGWSALAEYAAEVLDGKAAPWVPLE
jgi:protein disulfide-isomerase-like protein